MSPWRIGVIAFDVVAIGIIVGVLAMIMRAKDEKKNPDRYKPSKPNNL